MKIDLVNDLIDAGIHPITGLGPGLQNEPTNKRRNTYKNRYAHHIMMIRKKHKTRVYPGEIHIESKMNYQ